MGNRRSIHERPEIALKRGRIGDWERDTMFTQNGIKVLVCIDRKSRFIKLMKPKKDGLPLQIIMELSLRKQKTVVLTLTSVIL